MNRNFPANHVRVGTPSPLEQQHSCCHSERSLRREESLLSWVSANFAVANILVAALGTFQFWRAGHFSWKLILAIRAVFRSGRIRQRLPAAVCFGSPNFDRRCAAFFRSAPGVSPKRPTANDLSDCDRDWLQRR